MNDEARDKGLHRTNIEFFVKAMSQKPTVRSVEQENDRIFALQRERDDLSVYLANIYILGLADLDEILGDNPSVDTIVNINAYNTYTREAKAEATSRGVALFSAREFMGAVYFYGRDFMAYAPPERD